MGKRCRELSQEREEIIIPKKVKKNINNKQKRNDDICNEINKKVCTVNNLKKIIIKKPNMICTKCPKCNTPINLLSNTISHKQDIFSKYEIIYYTCLFCYEQFSTRMDDGEKEQYFCDSDGKLINL